MPKSNENPRGLETETRSASRQWSEQAELRIPTLTVLAHPDRQRVGERALLESLPAGRAARLARGEPAFAQPGERRERPLGDSRISRSPIRLSPGRSDRGRGDIDSIQIDCRGSSTAVEIEGHTPSAETEISREALERGVVLCLSHRIVLLLHVADPLAAMDSPSYGLVGASDAVAWVRAEIRRLAPLEVPVLVRGETGTGKELVATALHRAGSRSGGPWVPLSMAAIPPSLAAAELFGAAKGAYTGATKDRRGAFRRADGGTLFLDEIGDTPGEIQALLLRTLESREVLPVGADRAFSVDVRLVTATDLDFEAAAETGRFLAPLFHRIAGYELHLPPLRERREDFGRLFYHFLDSELDALGEAQPSELTGPGARRPWPPPEMVARLAARPWPGNVRQLRNATRQLAILGPAAPPVRFARWLELAGAGSRPDSPEEPPSAVASARPRPRPGDIGDDELLEVLRECRYRVVDAAERLGISRAAVYKLMERSARIRQAADLDRTEIAEALEQCDGDLAAMVERLEVSAPALRRRMRQLGFD